MARDAQRSLEPCSFLGKPSMTVRSGFVLEALREGPEFTLHRGWQQDNPSPILGIALAAEQPSSQSVRRLEYQYSIAPGLDPAASPCTRCLRARCRSLPDPLKGVQCYIAPQAIPPAERAALPGPLSTIVMKLLAKLGLEVMPAGSADAEAERPLPQGLGERVLLHRTG
jgi:hypothetical protein